LRIVKTKVWICDQYERVLLNDIPFGYGVNGLILSTDKAICKEIFSDY